MQSLQIAEDKLRLFFKTIGVANARYNSAIVYNNYLLISRGAHSKLCDIVHSKTIYQKQIGNSQITQINENTKYIVVVNFDGLITFLNKDDITQTKCQFRCAGKQIRHTYTDDEVFVVVAQVVGGIEQNILQSYYISDIQKGNFKPFFQEKGYYYYPEMIGNRLFVQEYNDPNPIKKSRKDTVMNKKLPVSNKLKIYVDYKHSEYLDFQQSDIVCTSQNKNHIFYLHSNKHISVFDSVNMKIYDFDPSQFKSNILAIESYKNGIIFSVKKKQFTYLFLKDGQLLTQQFQINSVAADIGFCLKFLQNGSFYSFNEAGLHYYDFQTKKTYTQQMFDITNCGLAISQDSKKLVVGDFVGNVYIFSTETGQQISRIFIGPPIRAIAWGEQVDTIFIGTIGGTLTVWNHNNQSQIQQLNTFDHTINCIRTGRGLAVVGNSNGQIFIYDQKTLKEVASHKAHHPIRYQDPKDRELFGSLQHFAEVWSTTISPIGPIRIATSSQDQTIRILELQGSILNQTHKLEGHEFAVTSIDWQVQKQGQIFVSCSDDKKVMVRNPNKNFQLLYEVQTSTIKQWHTLTYLSLQRNGQRIFVGSQNGYLFIYNTRTRQFQYANKINLGGIQGLASNDVLVTCSSDLCVNIIKYQ